MKKGFSVKTSHFGPDKPHTADLMPYCYKLANYIASRRGNYAQNIRLARNGDNVDEEDERFLKTLRDAGFDVDDLAPPETWRLPDRLNSDVVLMFTANILEYFSREEPTKTAKVQLSPIPGARDGMVTLGELCRGAARVLEIVAGDIDLKSELNFIELCDKVANFSSECANKMRKIDKKIAMELGTDMSKELAVAFV